MYTLSFSGVIQAWPEALPPEVVVWQTVNDDTKASNYYARWSDTIFVEITQTMFDMLMQHLSAQETT